MKYLPLQPRIHLALTCAAVLLCCVPATRAAQGGQRDHLTPAEVELIRNTQVIDKRTDVFIKAAERRLLLLTDAQVAQSKQVQKDKELWGELPKGTRAELCSDLAGIFDEAITNIDDVAARDENSPLLPKALRKLGAAAEHFATQLTPLREGAAEAERSSLEKLFDELQEIIDAAKKLPPDPKAKPAKP
jgi:hypothetical protein